MSYTALIALKLGGAAYLIYLSGCELWATSNTMPVESDTPNAGLFNNCRQGVLVNLFNPKAILFHLSFLPQFVVHDNGSEQLQLVFHGALVIALAVAIYCQ